MYATSCAVQFIRVDVEGSVRNVSRCRELGRKESVTGRRGRGCQVVVDLLRLSIRHRPALPACPLGTNDLSMPPLPPPARFAALRPPAHVDVVVVLFSSLFCLTVCVNVWYACSGQLSTRDQHALSSIERCLNPLIPSKKIISYNRRNSDNSYVLPTLQTKCFKR